VEAREDIRGQIGTRQMSDMQITVGIRPSDAHQNVFGHDSLFLPVCLLLARWCWTIGVSVAFAATHVKKGSHAPARKHAIRIANNLPKWQHSLLPD
jgi:hypothetical protein